MTKQKLREAMASAQQVRADVLAAPQQIAHRFFLVRRDVDRRQGTRTVQDRELARVTPIRFDAITRTPRDQRGRNDLARNLFGRHRALQLEAARAGFVTATYRSDLTLQSLDEAKDRGNYPTPACVAPASGGLGARPRRPSSPRADRTQ
jgi:hypothetical protein